MFTSVESIGIDPDPFYSPEYDTRSWQRWPDATWEYQPRAQYTHTPANPSALLCTFRWEWEYLRESYDLGELAEMRLNILPEPKTREERMFRRFLELCANVLPRPFTEFDARRDARLAA